jgi:hypothetical protein
MHHFGFPPQFCHHYQTTLWRCYLPSHPYKWEADRIFLRTYWCPSRLPLITNNLPVGDLDNVTGIHWNFTKHLENLDFVDDISLLSDNMKSYTVSQNKSRRVAFKSTKERQRSSGWTTKDPVGLHQESIKEVYKFVTRAAVLVEMGEQRKTL